MSDLLHLLSWISTAASAKYWPRIAAWLVGALLLWWLWTAESGLARFVGFIGLDVALYFGISDLPAIATVEWTRYLFVKLIFLALSAGQVIIKLILMAASRHNPLADLFHLTDRHHPGSAARPGVDRRRVDRVRFDELRGELEVLAANAEHVGGGGERSSRR